MKNFYVNMNIHEIVKNFTLLSQANNFVTLHNFGFDVENVTMSLLSDGGMIHFKLCSTRNVTQEGNSLTFIEEVNALTFYKNLLVSQDVSPYCSACFRRASSTAGDAMKWRGIAESLQNMVLYTSEIITNLRFFHTVSSAFNEFMYAVSRGTEFFGEKPNALFRQVIVEQTNRLNAAKELFVNDEELLCSELIKMSTEPGILNILTGVSTGKFLTAPFSDFAFNAPNDTKRDASEWVVENKILNVLEILFLDSKNRFLFGPEIFLKLWAHVSFKTFNIIFPLCVTDVPEDSVFEFVETLNGLSKGQFFESESFLQDINNFGFDAAKFCHLVETSADLVKN